MSGSEGMDRSKRGVLALCVGALVSLAALLWPLASNGLADLAAGPYSQDSPFDPPLSLAQQRAEAASAPQAKEAPYIVVLKDSVSHPGAVAQDQAAEVDGEIGFVYRLVLNGYSATMPREEVESLEEDPRVKYVTPDHKVEAFAQTSPTGVQRIGATGNEKLLIDEKDNLRVNADVAVIDSGVDYEHPDLNVFSRTNCVPADNDPEAAECLDGAGSDGNSHGTHVAGTIGARDNGEGVVGVAPGARLWAVKVLADNGSGYDSWIIAGVEWVTAHAAQIEVANMSLGCKCSQPALDEAIEASAEAGVVYAIGAGNSHADAKDFSPAGNPDAITVSALADSDGKSGGKGSSSCWDDSIQGNRSLTDDTLAFFSNFGADVDVAAPGVCILSTKPGGGYQALSGTSMASPHVAGAAALLASMKNPESLADVEAIRKTILEKGSSAWEDTSGDGVKEPLLDVSDKAAFSPADQVAVTKPATILSKSEVTLRGEVNPGGIKTEYQFEYGTTASYGSKAPTTKGSSSATAYTAVSQSVSGLSGKTLYHYRLVATNSKGTFYGADQTFGTTPPTVTTGEAKVLSANAAELKGTANPEGLSTTYSIEYGTTTGYGKKALIESESLGSGTTSVSANGIAGLLNGDTTYHYRLAATNVAGKAVGADKTLTTPTADYHVDESWESEPGFTTNASFNDISCVSDTECMAIGNPWQWPEGKPEEIEKSTVISHWNGKEWSDVAVPETLPEEFLRSISCTSPDFCMAVATYIPFHEESAVYIWDGESWQRVEQAEISGLFEAGHDYLFTDASCTSSSFCAISVWQFGNGLPEPNLLIYEEGEWSLLDAPLPAGAVSGILQSVSCATATACVAVGSYSYGSQEYQLVEEFDGEEVNLTGQEAGNDPKSVLGYVSCWGESLASMECAALGGAIGGGLFVRWYDGDVWSTEVPPLPPGAMGGFWTGLSCAKAGVCSITGLYYNPSGETQAFVEGWNGSSWVLETTTNPSDPMVGDIFYGISCPSGSCIIAGGYSAGLAEKELLPAVESNLPRSEPSFLFSFGKEGSGNGQFDEPFGISIDSEGDAWVADSGNNRFQQFDSEGKYLNQLNNFYLRYPTSLALDAEGDVWTTSGYTTPGYGYPMSTLVSKFDSEEGKLLKSFGSEGSGNGELEGAWDIAIDSKGDLWVADADNNRVQKFNSKGEYLSQFGKGGSGDGQFKFPDHVAIDSEDNIWVADAENNRVQKFNSKGEYLSQFGKKGSGDGQFECPGGIAIDPEGDVWVADEGNNRVQEFSSKGKYLSQLGEKGSGAGQMKDPTDVAIDPEGNIWVTDYGNRRVEVWAP